MRVIDRIPLPESTLRQGSVSDIEYDAWEFSDLVVFSGNVSPSRRLRAFYSLGYYRGQVLNGGHSQLTYNMDIGEKRSSFLIDSYLYGTQVIGAPKFGEIASKYRDWLGENEVEAELQTGFEGGRDEYLDHLDDLFIKTDEDYSEYLRDRLISTEIEEEKTIISKILREERIHHFDAIVILWLLRSDMLIEVPDATFKETAQAILAPLN